MSKKGMIFAAILLIAVILFAFSNLNPRTVTIKKQPVTKSEITNKPENTIITTPSISNTVIPDNPKKYPGTVEFSSVDLGIAFNYLPEYDNLKINTLEKDNRVYIFESKLNAQDGQFVEVFKKDPGDSLAEAVRKKFLAGKSANDCFVVDSQAVFSNYPANYKAVEISFPKPTDDQEPWWGRGDACSSEYAETNGIRYFLGDINHPDKFLFFDIGQYSIIAGKDLTWQDTIRFLD